jgi:hypothetical protein
MALQFARTFTGGDSDLARLIRLAGAWQARAWESDGVRATGIDPSERTPDARSLLRNQGDVQRFFWLVFFVPVNLLFQAALFALVSIQPVLDSAPYVIVAVKTAYFLMVCFGVLTLRTAWQPIDDLPSRTAAWAYRLLGLVSIAALLVVHAGSVYQFGRMEREINRNMLSANKALPITPQAGLRVDRVTLERRDWIYESTLTRQLAAQIDRAKFGMAVRPVLAGAICADAWQRRLLSRGIRIRYVYRDRSGELVVDEPFERGTCAEKT